MRKHFNSTEQGYKACRHKSISLCKYHFKFIAMIKKILLDIIDYYRYKIDSDQCTESDMRSAFNLLSNNLVCDTTIKDLALHYNQSESNVRNVIARFYIPKPKRRVFYNFIEFLKVMPDKWLDKND